MKHPIAFFAIASALALPASLSFAQTAPAGPQDATSDRTPDAKTKTPLSQTDHNTSGATSDRSPDRNASTGAGAGSGAAAGEAGAEAPPMDNGDAGRLQDDMPKLDKE